MLEDRFRWVVVFVFDRRRGSSLFFTYFASGNIKLTGPPEFPPNQEISHPDRDPVR